MTRVKTINRTFNKLKINIKNFNKLQKKLYQNIITFQQLETNRDIQNAQLDTIEHKIMASIEQIAKIKYHLWTGLNQFKQLQISLTVEQLEAAEQ